MSGFSSDWLALREPFDAAARSAPLVRELAEQLGSHSAAAPLQIVDLGAGAGSNLRYVAPLLGGAQRWRLVDHDAVLLAAAQRTTRAWARARGAAASETAQPLTVSAREFACTVTCEERDLARDWPDIPPRALVTAAALLDLVSADWLDGLVRTCKNANAAVHFALTYDGRTTCSPAEPEDVEALALFNRHQLGDKSFGPGLGPNAASAALERFAAAGYALRCAHSDWHIGSEHGAMQQALLDGWLDAAVETAPARRAALVDWHRRRSAHVAAGRSALAVGHVDIVGWR